MLDRTIAPPFQRTTSFDLITPEKVLLPNGIAAYYIAGGNQDVIKVELVFKAGRWYEEQWGASHFASNLLLKGTSKKDSATIANGFDFYGSHIEINPGLDNVSVSLYSLTKYLAPSLSLLLEIITDSVFPEKELEQTKSIFLQNLTVNNEKTSFLASKLFRKKLYGEQHPYGKELDESDVNALTSEVLRQQFTKFKNELFILVSGKISSQDISIINETFSALATSTAASKAHPQLSTSAGRTTAEKEGSIQSSIRVGKRFINRSHPDYADVLLLNHILGGYFGSRLMKNIREEKGLSYGIYSSIHTLQNDSYVVIGSDVNKENLELTFSEIQHELTRLRDERISADELNTARNHFIGSLQAEINTPFAHADKIKNIITFSLPENYYQKLIGRLDAIAAEDLQNTAQKYYQQHSFNEVAVG